VSTTIRHAQPDDAAALHRIMSSPQVIRGTLVMPFARIDQVHEHLKNLPAGSFWLVSCADDEPTGSLRLDLHTAARRRHAATLAIAVRDDWQGRGVGSVLMAAALDLADNWLNLTRIEMQSWTDNVSALALYQKFGFVIEGTHRAFAFRDGQYIDAHALARVRV
jgi:putative acetyltransferase